MRSSDYRELKVWNKAMDLVELIYELTKFLPRGEAYGLTDQLRRAAVSIPSNIAEGHGRITDKEFVKFLSIARGSLLEVETQLEICIRLGFLSREKTIIAQQSITEQKKMINSLIGYLYDCNQ